MCTYITCCATLCAHDRGPNNVAVVCSCVQAKRVIVSHARNELEMGSCATSSLRICASNRISPSSVYVCVCQIDAHLHLHAYDIDANCIYTYNYIINLDAKTTYTLATIYPRTPRLRCAQAFNTHAHTHWHSLTPHTHSELLLSATDARARIQLNSRRACDGSLNQCVWLSVRCAPAKRRRPH